MDCRDAQRLCQGYPLSKVGTPPTHSSGKLYLLEARQHTDNNRNHTKLGPEVEAYFSVRNSKKTGNEDNNSENTPG